MELEGDTSIFSSSVSFDPSLDENGLPIDEYDESKSNSSSFASEFYNSGTDWSRLSRNKRAGSGETLVQRDLFQMWGIKKPEAAADDESRVVRVSSTQRNLFDVWGIKKPEAEASSRKRTRNGKMVRRVEHSSVENGFDRPRACPFYKKLPGTPFTVDAFRYGSIEGCSAYFLSHFHYDHYGGLNKKWTHGRIYCTDLTARLVKMCIGVDPLYIYPLELDKEHVIEGIKVTMLEANHCPGAALIHFRLKDGKNYLHTGDFRASELMKSYTLLSQHIEVLYLDTTYCDSKYRFPPKEDVVNFVVKITRDFLVKQPKTLIVVGAYSIGKEQVYVAISQALGLPIYTNASRRRILKSFGWPELSGKLCSHGDDSSLHVLPLSFLRHENLKEYVKSYKQQYAAVLAFRPTGWTYSETIGNELGLLKPNCKGNVTIYGVPYSEHSSFTELQSFVKFLRPDKIIPTVNVGNATTRDKMQSYFREWLKD